MIASSNKTIGSCEFNADNLSIFAGCTEDNPSLIEVTYIFCDNQSCVKLSENPVFHGKLKHIEIKYHYIRDMVQRGALKLKYVVTNEQIDDVLTKPLVRVKFKCFRDKLGVI